MKHPRTIAAALAVVGNVLALQATDPGAAAGSTGQGRDVVTQFVGMDGLKYVPADFITHGLDGTLFIGSDFDALCGLDKGFTTGLGRLAKLAKIIQKSGRTATFALAPDKSSVESSELPSPLPHGECDAAGLAHTREVLDTYPNPQFVQVRAQLAKTPYAYWKTDAHWDTVGAAVYAQAVARKLSPKLARIQRYRSTTRTHLGDLESQTLLPVAETAPAKVPDNGVTMTPTHGSPAYDPTLGSVYTKLSWDSSPAKKVWPGKTLFIGDSFTYTALESLGNLVRHGEFLWLGYNSQADVVDAIKHSDTVVITVVQRFASISVAQSPAFIRAVKAALR